MTQIGSSSGPCLSRNAADLLNLVWPSVVVKADAILPSRWAGPAPGAVTARRDSLGMQTTSRQLNAVLSLHNH